MQGNPGVLHDLWNHILFVVVRTTHDPGSVLGRLLGPYLYGMARCPFLQGRSLPVDWEEVAKASDRPVTSSLLENFIPKTPNFFLKKLNFFLEEFT
jgi:hypothetical protein